MSKNLTALYLRLSRDDGTLTDSESIVNQKSFLLEYAKANSFNVVEIFSDDGYSGLSFDRPEFNRMIKLIEEKKINTVITKDLSRLGRDYIEVGNYIDKYFPLHCVRYIAVNDGIDTGMSQSTNDMTPFRAVFNDMYAKDISKKVRTALTTKKSNGKFIGSQPPYGYKKDPKDKNHLIIDEDTALYVRRIYSEFLSGGTVLGIAHKLSLDKIPTPSEQKGLTATQKCFKGVWNDVIIRRILTNPTYAGHLTQNMTRKVSYKIDKKVRLPKSEWIIIKNTHEPIISQDDFDAVAEILSKRSYHKRKRTGKQHLLSGLVFCKDCGGSMSFVKESETRTYLVCSRWRKNAKLGICTSHSIRESYVENVIKDKLKELASVINTSEILSDADAFFVKENNNEKLIESIKRKIDVCKNTLLSLYKDKALGVISEDEFIELSKGIKSERAVYEQRLNELLEEASSINSAKDISELLSNIISFENIDRNTLLMLIDKVYIDKNKNIEIQFKFDNPMI
ncbi:MAG: hypothetical protein E7389_05560 [Ruminococcaceae bacterium]|nr:hypothetical protein [Oscillospiraceae bacterium]